MIAYGEYSMAVHESYDPALRWILPLEVRGPTPFTLFAVWTVPNAPTDTYVQCLFDACERYAPLLRSGRVVLAGDFNSNVAFDKPNQALNFANLLLRLAEMNLRSVYHIERGCDHGAESEPTFFLHHNAEKKHHIDFVFATPDLYRDGLSVSIAQHSEWGKSSDHMPVVCSFGSDAQ